LTHINLVSFNIKKIYNNIIYKISSNKHFDLCNSSPDEFVLNFFIPIPKLNSLNFTETTTIQKTKKDREPVYSPLDEKKKHPTKTA